MKLYIFIALILLPLVNCKAQYYPAPPPIGYQREPGLLLQLRNAKSDLEKTRVQLQLCNLYFNKPFKKKADLEKALNHARKASALSTSLHDSAGYIDAQLSIADVLLGLHEIQAAENILPLLNDSAKIDLLLALSFTFWTMLDDTATADQEKEIQYAQQARDLSIRLHQPEKEILALMDIASVHIDQHKKSAEQELLDVIAKYRSIGYRNLHYAYGRLAYCEFTQGKYEKATYWSLEALKSMRSTGDSLIAGDLYAVHASICGAVDEYQQCINYSRLAIQSYALHAGIWPLSEAVMKLAYGFRKMNRFSEGVDTLQRVVKEYPPDNFSADINYNMAIGNLYTDSKKFTKAESYLLRALALERQHGMNATLLDRDLGHLYVETRQYEKARPYLNMALSGPSSFSFHSYTHYLLYLVDFAAGNYKAAIEHLYRNHTLVDSSLAESKQRDIQRLLIQFETQKKEDSIKIKDQNIALLNEKTAIQQIKLNKKTLLINLTIGGVFLVLVIAALLYRENRNKKRVNKVLEKLLTEKEWLLKEVHHRVKNNLHTIMCLLESQASRLKKEGLAAVEDSQHRIYAMSLIHKKLYQSEDIKSILMDKYIAELVEYLDDSFRGECGIQFVLDIESLRLNIEQAIPVALIINEAVTNSMKHAFPDKRPGMVTINMHKSGDQITLLLADNGIGIGDRPTAADTNSLGLELMKGLAREIHGRIEFASQSGTKITMIFYQDTPLVRHEAAPVSGKKEVYQ
jgi:two-component system, sensor histidine kinase PdtaS